MSVITVPTARWVWSADGQDRDAIMPAGKEVYVHDVIVKPHGRAWIAFTVFYTWDISGETVGPLVTHGDLRQEVARV